MDVLPFGSLVGNISEDRQSALLSQLYQFAQDVVACHAGAVVALSYLQEEAVHRLVAQRLVDKSHHSTALLPYLAPRTSHLVFQYPPSLHAECCCGEILPVAVVSEHPRDRLSLVHIFLHLVASAKLEVSEQFVVADMEQLDGLYGIVAQPVVELSLDGFYFSATLFRERRRKVLPDHLAPIPYDMVHQQVETVAYRVERTIGQERNEPCEAIDDVICHLDICVY